MLDKKALVLLANQAYLEYALQVFYTAVVNGNWQNDLLLLAYDIEDDSKLTIFRERNIKVKKLSSSTFNFNNIHPEKAVYFAKIYLFHPDFNNYHQLVFLDIDVIVRKDINDLLDFKGFAAADDCFQYPLIHQFTSKGEAYENSEINKYYSKDFLAQRSFNTGVMVIPSSNNTDQAYQKLCTLVEKYGHLSTFFDQGIINLHLLNKRQRLPYIYNDYYYSEYFNRRGLLKRKSDGDAAILHIIHPNKPWNIDCDYHREWLSNLKKAQNSEWKSAIIKKVTKFSKLKIDCINELSIREIYFVGRIRDSFNYWKWRISLFIKERF